MKRRDFIAALGSAAVAWPMGLHAQQMPVIGFLNSRRFDKNGPLAGAFRRGLAENGYVEGRNIVIEYRSADGDYARLSALAAELARLPVDVLVSVGGEPSAVAARAATSKIPTVSTIGTDPVRLRQTFVDTKVLSLEPGRCSTRYVESQPMSFPKCLAVQFYTDD